MHQIVKNLYLGSIRDVTTDNINGYDLIINVTSDLSLPVHFKNELRFPVEDNGNPDMNRIISSHFPMACEMIEKYLYSNRKVLVVCQMGRQRSATIIAAYLKRNYRISSDDAIKYIKARKRDAFFPRANFYQSLQSWEK